MHMELSTPNLGYSGVTGHASIKGSGLCRWSSLHSIPAPPAPPAGSVSSGCFRYGPGQGLERTVSLPNSAGGPQGAVTALAGLARSSSLACNPAQQFAPISGLPWPWTTHSPMPPAQPQQSLQPSRFPQQPYGLQQAQYIGFVQQQLPPCQPSYMAPPSATAPANPYVGLPSLAPAAHASSYLSATSYPGVANTVAGNLIPKPELHTLTCLLDEIAAAPWPGMPPSAWLPPSALGTVPLAAAAAATAPQPLLSAAPWLAPGGSPCASAVVAAAAAAAAHSAAAVSMASSYLPCTAAAAVPMGLTSAAPPPVMATALDPFTLASGTRTPTLPPPPLVTGSATLSAALRLTAPPATAAAMAPSAVAAAAAAAAAACDSLATIYDIQTLRPAATAAAAAAAVEPAAFPNNSASIVGAGAIPGSGGSAREAAAAAAGATARPGQKRPRAGSVIWRAPGSPSLAFSDGGGGGGGGGGGRISADGDGEGDGENSTLEAIRATFDLPVRQAAKRLGMGGTQLKRRCRALGIRRWPQRKLASLARVAEAVATDAGLAEEQRKDLLRSAALSRAEIMQDPDAPLREELAAYRQVVYKVGPCKRASGSARGPPSDEEGGSDSD